LKKDPETDNQPSSKIQKGMATSSVSIEKSMKMKIAMKKFKKIQKIPHRTDRSDRTLKNKDIKSFVKVRAVIRL
jgi:predicted lipase